MHIYICALIYRYMLNKYIYSVSVYIYRHFDVYVYMESYRYSFIIIGNSTIITNSSLLIVVLLKD